MLNNDFYDDKAVPTDLIPLIKKYFMVDEGNILLLATCIIGYFMNIETPIVLFIGNAGSGKTTATRLLQNIYDPNSNDVYALPTKVDDLALLLKDNALTVIDNIETISTALSNTLCMAITGGQIMARELYTNDATVRISLRSNIIMNGISMPINKEDLQSRTLVFDLNKGKINLPARKDRNTLTKSLKEDKPMIIGAVFKTISYYINHKNDNISVSNICRLTEFNRLGHIIATVLGKTQEDFVKALLSNTTSSSNEVIENNATLQSLKKFAMHNHKWNGTPTELYDMLVKINNQNHYGKLPNGVSIMSKLIKKYSDLLNQNGITVHIGQRNGSDRRISIINNNLQDDKKDDLSNDKPAHQNFLHEKHWSRNFHLISKQPTRQR